MAQARCIFALVFSVEADYACPKHRHACTEIVHLGSSQGTLRTGSGKGQPYKTGDLLVYQPGEEHWIENRRAGTHVCVGVAGCGAADIPAGVWPGSELITPLFDRVRESLAQPATTLRQERLDLLAGLIALEVRVRVEPDPEPRPDYAAQAKKIIDARFHEPLDLSQLASGLFISPVYLRQLFKQAFGRGPIQYLIQKRIDIAREMLTTTDWPIQRIAEACGFENPYYFSRLFHKVTGQSPGQYRKANKR